MESGEIKTDLFPDRLRAGRKNGEQRKYGQNRKGGIYKNVVISVEASPEQQIVRKDEKSGADVSQ